MPEESLRLATVIRPTADLARSPRSRDQAAKGRQNRASDSINGNYTCNDLNMPTKVGSGSTNNYSNDVLGNRDSDRSEAVYGWDQLNRLTSYMKSSTTTSYAYRADGMRVQKSTSSAGTTFAYDGQMGFEDTDTGSSPAVTDYAIGPRGIDRLAKTVSGTTTTVYPVFDGHGNMVATLGESGASYTTGDCRQYDAWGNILNSDGSGDPKGRYCANLGHKQDDESGLIYMRARYYDAATGRFTSQDKHQQGINWFTYCGEDPLGSGDPTGGVYLSELVIGGLLSLLGVWLFIEAETLGSSGLMFLDGMFFSGATGIVVAGFGLAFMLAACAQEIGEATMEIAKAFATMPISDAENFGENLVTNMKESGNCIEEIAGAETEINFWMSMIDADDD